MKFNPVFIFCSFGQYYKSLWSQISFFIKIKITSCHKLSCNTRHSCQDILRVMEIGSFVFLQCTGFKWSVPCPDAGAQCWLCYSMAVNSLEQKSSRNGKYPVPSPSHIHLDKILGFVTFRVFLKGHFCRVESHQQGDLVLPFLFETLQTRPSQVYLAWQGCISHTQSKVFSIL